MPKYQVTVPFAGTLTVEVEADNKKDAIEKAIEVGTLDDIDEWDARPVMSLRETI